MTRSERCSVRATVTHAGRRVITCLSCSSSRISAGTERHTWPMCWTEGASAHSLRGRSISTPVSTSGYLWLFLPNGYLECLKNLSVSKFTTYWHNILFLPAPCFCPCRPISQQDISNSCRQILMKFWRDVIIGTHDEQQTIGFWWWSASRRGLSKAISPLRDTGGCSIFADNSTKVVDKLDKMKSLYGVECLTNNKLFEFGADQHSGI